MTGNEQLICNSQTTNDALSSQLHQFTSQTGGAGAGIQMTPEETRTGCFKLGTLKKQANKKPQQQTKVSSRRGGSEQSKGKGEWVPGMCRSQSEWQWEPVIRASCGLDVTVAATPQISALHRTHVTFCLSRARLCRFVTALARLHTLLFTHKRRSDHSLLHLSQPPHPQVVVSTQHRVR